MAYSIHDHAIVNGNGTQGGKLYFGSLHCISIIISIRKKFTINTVIPLLFVLDC